MNRRSFLQLAAAGSLPAAQSNPAQKPNIIFILADDIGYGDLGCYGAKQVRTPNLDALAKRGIRFTDAHSSAATCTPSRYSLLTGEYAWRKPGTNILPGDAALIIQPGRPTLPSQLKRAGYRTGVVGKWHLGLGSGSIDWNGEIGPGPLDIGFDYSFLIPATGDRVPCVYVENRRVVGLDPNDPIRVSYKEPVGDEPTGRDHPELLRMKLSRGHDQTIVNGISRIGYMSGGKSARWKDEDMADTITRKAVSFIGDPRPQPFFLYFATHDIHVPRVPHARFKGDSKCGVRCDAIVELDWCVGQIMKELDRRGIARNTLLMFSSDNGPVVDDGYADGAVENLNGHTPAGSLKGGKYSPYEAGTRVPFIASWPGRIRPATSDALVSQIDLMSSLSALAGIDLPADSAPDSMNVLPALLGESRQARDHLVEQASVQSLRKGSWKLVPRPKQNSPELFDLSKDPAEAQDVAAAHPERVAEMQNMLDSIRQRGRSRP